MCWGALPRAPFPAAEGMVVSEVLSALKYHPVKLGVQRSLGALSLSGHIYPQLAQS